MFELSSNPVFFLDCLSYDQAQLGPAETLNNGSVSLTVKGNNFNFSTKKGYTLQVGFFFELQTNNTK